MKESTEMIEDGDYFLYPAGSAWIAARFRGGKLMGTAYESDAASHGAANDVWAGVVPSEQDTEVSGAVADCLVREVMGDEVNPEMVVVAKASS